MASEHCAQRKVQQVGCSVVCLAVSAPFLINHSLERNFGMLRKFIGNVKRKIVLTFCIYDVNRFKFADKFAVVANLSAHFCIERRGVENYFVMFLLLLLHHTIPRDMAFALCSVPANELLFAAIHCYPVAKLNLSCVSRTFFLFLHFVGKTFLVYRHSVL